MSSNDLKVHLDNASSILTTCGTCLEERRGSEAVAILNNIARLIEGSLSSPEIETYEKEIFLFCAADRLREWRRSESLDYDIGSWTTIYDRLQKTARVLNSKLAIRKYDEMYD